MTTDDYYRRLKDLARKDIRNINDEAALSLDPTSWVNHVFDATALRPVEIATDRTASFADRTSGVRVVLPVVPSVTLETIIEYQLGRSAR